jgi:hypothetical protein
MISLGIINRLKISTLIIFSFLFIGSSSGQQKQKLAAMPSDTIYMNANHAVLQLEFIFMKGSSYYHPTFALWLENENAEFTETLFVTRYFGTGLYAYADKGDGKWTDEKGESIRPAALPYWAHKRNVISRDSLYIPTPENPLPDAITGATPQNDFVLVVSPSAPLPQRFKILFEINQPWDWNEFWTNSKYPEDKDYLSSAQPSLIYEADMDLSEPDQIITLKPIGHGHYSGKNGKLYSDLTTMTTALSIAKEITVQIKN